MNVEEFQAYCLAKKGVEETFPFSPDTLVYKVMGKMFTITGLDNPEFTVTLKCDPDRAIELREQYPEILPGYHTDKKHWNTVSFEGSLDDKLLRELIDHSYDLVVSKFPKKLKVEWEQL